MAHVRPLPEGPAGGERLVHSTAFGVGNSGFSLDSADPEQITQLSILLPSRCYFGNEDNLFPKVTVRSRVNGSSMKSGALAVVLPAAAQDKVQCLASNMCIVNG